MVRRRSNLLQDARSRLFLPKRRRIPIFLLALHVRVGACRGVFLLWQVFRKCLVEEEMNAAEVISTHVLAFKDAPGYAEGLAMK